MNMMKEEITVDDDFLKFGSGAAKAQKSRFYYYFHGSLLLNISAIFSQ
jgi:hypothetical protein